MATILTREEVVATGLLTVHQDKHHNEVVIPDRYDAISDGVGCFMRHVGVLAVLASGMGLIHLIAATITNGSHQEHN